MKGPKYSVGLSVCSRSLLQSWSDETNSVSRFGADFWISVILSLIAILSGIFSVVPKQSLERVYVILSAGLGGYWCSKFLLTEPNFRRIFQWFVNALLLCVIFLALLGLYLTGKPHQFLDFHWHPVGSRLLLMSFAPLSLLFGNVRRDRILGGIILSADLITIYIVGRYAFIESILIIPAIVSVIAFFVFKWTGASRRIMAVILALTVVAGVFFVYANPKNLNRDHISVAYRVESLFFSIDIASKHPWLGNGLWAPRDLLAKDYALHYPFVSAEQFSEWVTESKDLRRPLFDLPCRPRSPVCHTVFRQCNVSPDKVGSDDSQAGLKPRFSSCGDFVTAISRMLAIYCCG